MDGAIGAVACELPRVDDSLLRVYGEWPADASSSAGEGGAASHTLSLELPHLPGAPRQPSRSDLGEPSAPAGVVEAQEALPRARQNAPSKLGDPVAKTDVWTPRAQGPGPSDHGPRTTDYCLPGLA